MPLSVDVWASAKRGPAESRGGVAAATLAACEATIRAADARALRRWLSSHLVQSSGRELLLLAARLLPLALRADAAVVYSRLQT